MTGSEKRFVVLTSVPVLFSCGFVAPERSTSLHGTVLDLQKRVFTGPLVYLTSAERKISFVARSYT